MHAISVWKKLFILIVILFFAIIIFQTCSGVRGNEENVRFEDVAGTWAGNARVVNNWCRIKLLLVLLEISPGGSVKGTLGDARIINGSISKRNWIMTHYDHTTHTIRGRLEGPINRLEAINRDAFTMHLRIDQGRVTNGLINTSGHKSGGKQYQILTAFRLNMVINR